MCFFDNCEHEWRRTFLHYPPHPGYSQRRCTYLYAYTSEICPVYFYKYIYMCVVDITPPITWEFRLTWSSLVEGSNRAGPKKRNFVPRFRNERWQLSCLKKDHLVYVHSGVKHSQKQQSRGNCLLITVYTAHITIKVDAICSFIFVIEIKPNLLWNFAFTQRHKLFSRKHNSWRKQKAMEVFGKLKLFQLILLGCSALGFRNNPSVLWDSNNPM